MKPLVSLTIEQWDAVWKAINFALDIPNINDPDLVNAKNAIEHQLGWAEPKEGHTEPEYTCQLCNPKGGD